MIKRKIGKARWKEQGRFKCTMKPIDKNVVWVNANAFRFHLLIKLKYTQ